MNKGIKADRNHLGTANRDGNSAAIKTGEFENTFKRESVSHCNIKNWI